MQRKVLYHSLSHNNDLMFNKNLRDNTKSIVKYLNISKKDTCITTLPMSYVYGLSIINTHIYTGVNLVLNDHSVLKKKHYIIIQKHLITLL